MAALRWDALLARATATTIITCGSQFSWMDNSDGHSPCLLAITLYASCFTRNWNLKRIGPKFRIPNSSRANFCTCSWAVYNLLGACTVCQNSTNIPDWNAYTMHCGNYLTDTSFPTDKVVPLNHTLLPYWATIYPATWTDEQFNVTQAQAMHNSNHPDVHLSIPTATTHKSISVSAVAAGGAVGGVIGAVLIAVAIFLYLRYGQKIHKRVLSDASQKATRPASLVAASHAPTPVSTVYSPISPTNPFLRTHLHRPPQSTMMRMSVQRAKNGATPEDVVSLFTFTSTAAPVNGNRRPDRRLYPIYEEPTVEAASRTRLNRYAHNESVSNEREESALLSAHSPTPSADREGRVHGPSGFYGFDNDEEYRNNAANLDKASWSIGSIWRRIWFR
ncbi:hypothetical protein F5887DRAFT_528936 [Amanita rubescens]|nr:hypothetical protein F5887DRAFT_528936 [Amanita rubescens]